MINFYKTLVDSVLKDEKNNNNKISIMVRRIKVIKLNALNVTVKRLLNLGFLKELKDINVITKVVEKHLLKIKIILLDVQRSLRKIIKITLNFLYKENPLENVLLK